MRHLKSGRKLSRRKEHRTAMLANLAASIIQHGRVHTTDAKAKEVRPFIERMVTFARRGDLHARRIVLSRLKGNQSAVKKLFDEIGPRYTARPGGYTRILKLGFRQGDNSAMSLIEFVGEEIEKKKKEKSKKAEGKRQKAEESIEVVDDKSAVEEIEKSDEVRSDEERVEAAGPETEAKEKTAESAPEPSETVLEKKEAEKKDTIEAVKAEAEEKAEEENVEKIDTEPDDKEETALSAPEPEKEPSEPISENNADEQSEKEK